MEQDLNSTCLAFRLAEEQACGNYLDARKDMVAKARRAASLAQLVTEQPHRIDYHQVWTEAVTAHQAAVARTRLAYQAWQRALQRTDAARPAPALAAVFRAAGQDGEAA